MKPKRTVLLLGALGGLVAVGVLCPAPTGDAPLADLYVQVEPSPRPPPGAVARGRSTRATCSTWR